MVFALCLKEVYSIAHNMLDKKVERNICKIQKNENKIKTKHVTQITNIKCRSMPTCYDDKR